MNKIVSAIVIVMTIFILGLLLIVAIDDLSSCDPSLSQGTVIIEQYHAREIVTMADGHRMIDKPGYWYIRVEGENGKWREVKLREWQTMHVNVGDWVIVRGDYDIERIGA